MTPDVALCHITFHELPQPTNKSEWHHYQHRAGVKVTHQCCALLGELKKAPRRTFRGPARLHDTAYSLISQAQTEVLTYCAAYFEGNAQAEPVIALAAMGPYWKWAVIGPTDVEGLYDWTDHREDDEKAKELRKKFQPRPFVLGTRKSDEELTKISQRHIYPLLSMPHVGAT
ncbi:hypothetical protein F5887DRAFT_900699 [Amanita rubescens]|nr:hypothetical protein F5887DRAFT_900699 [Amanita rubescens]